MSVLKSAKRGGCSGFVASRVSLEPVLRWIFSRDSDGSDNWSERLKRALALRAEVALERDKGRSWDAGEVHDAVTAAVAAFFREMERGFDQLPAKLLGLSEVGIAEQLSKVRSEMSAELRQGVRKLIDERKG